MITTIQQDINNVNQTRTFRKSIGSTQKAAYPYSWRQSSMVILTYFTALNAEAIQSTIKSVLDMSFGKNLIAVRLAKVCSRNEDPHYVYREYANGFPGLARKLGLKRRLATQAEIELFSHRTDARGAAVKYVYYFVNPETAKQILIAEYPGLLSLFVALDTFKRENKF